MDAKTFLAEFGHIANAPSGVNKLRELILGLAITGRLLGNNLALAEDIEDQLENVRDKYLNKINKKHKLIKFGKALLNEPEIPDGWLWTRVGAVCDLQTGATPSRKQPEFFGGEIRWLVSGDINKGEITECEGRITEEGLQNSNCKVLPKNSVLIALNGQGKTRATVALLRVPAACNQSLVAMIPFSMELILPEFLFYSLKYRYFEIRDITGQKQRRGLNMGLVSELSVPLAPLEEQKRIAKKVDELMKLCDKLETQQQQRSKLNKLVRKITFNSLENTTGANQIQEVWNRIYRNLNIMFLVPEDVNDIRNLIRDFAVKGLLVEQNELERSAANLLEGIKSTKEKLINESAIGKQTKLRQISDAEKPFNLPKGWVFVRLGEITNKIGSGSTPRGGQKAYVREGIPFLRSQNIWNDGIRLSDVAFINKETNKKMANTIVQEKDILLNITGASLGRCALVPDEFPVSNVSQHVSIVRPTNEETRHYLHLCMLSPYVQKLIWGRQVGMAREGLSKKVLEQFEIPLPPLVEQKRIVARVSYLMAICDNLENKLKDSMRVSKLFSDAAVTSVIGTKVEEKEKMKTPKTELVSQLKLNVSPANDAQAPLSAILIKHNGELSAKALWNYSGLDIQDFYQQLKIEMANRWIVEPEKAGMRELEVG